MHHWRGRNIWTFWYALVCGELGFSLHWTPVVFLKLSVFHALSEHLVDVNRSGAAECHCCPGNGFQAACSHTYLAPVFSVCIVRKLWFFNCKTHHALKSLHVQRENRAFFASLENETFFTGITLIGNSWFFFVWTLTHLDIWEFWKLTNSSVTQEPLKQQGEYCFQLSSFDLYFWISVRIELPRIAETL